MDVGIDLNAKYVIMCRKTVLILENYDESTHLGVWQTLSLTIMVFSAKRAKR